MCKIWKCSADDERFNSITENQWLWYSQMIYQDKKDNYDYMLDLAEYMASFWNAEAVKKVRDARDSAGDERFATDEEFERQILDGSFKNDEIIKTIKERYKNTNLQDISRDRDGRNTRMPRDMSKLFSMTGDKIE